MTRCRRCLLPAAVPGADLDRARTCAWCRSASPSSASASEVERARAGYERDLEEALATRATGGEYDAVVCLSGGKDSLYLLHRVVLEHGLRVLALTVAIDLPDVARRNIARAVQRLDVDHLVIEPRRGFVRKLFRYLLTHQEARGAVYTLSYVYAPLFESAALRVAAERAIPLVLAGYSPGQPEPERMTYEFARELLEDTDWTPPALAASGAFCRDELAAFWDPRRFAGRPLPRYLAPLHAWPYDQDAIVREVAALGLVATKADASPLVSNYPINWLMMYSDLARFGHNPYAPEFSSLIRSGRASRAYWRLAAPAVDAMIRHRVGLGSEVRRSLEWLGLSAGDLRITEPRGAYDPEVGALRGSRERPGSLERAVDRSPRRDVDSTFLDGPSGS
jgi:hypothetical protein